MEMEENVNTVGPNLLQCGAADRKELALFAMLVVIFFLFTKILYNTTHFIYLFFLFYRRQVEKWENPVRQTVRIISRWSGWIDIITITDSNEISQ
jgi:hypothetical protein